MSYSDPDPSTPNPPPGHESSTEEFSVNSETLVSKVQELLNESNIRRIVIKNAEGRTLLEIPLTAGLIGGAVGLAYFSPLVAIASIGMLAARFTLVVERRV
ncbi:hypothetical protein N836_22530 [Leptolyngbya sp. Heron Island J]|uniref:DUF4342 domain-containing protein n=1 Tax=Leptolyngbya sp. Heron Island J TaxID=1385935 RepID=UPI0003B9EF3F|nr:DUF4342 domain-containing protein [Leptolyngbya sp. Heron Island J]ESA33171.1 hypothetical protein N836_22530 [Leptolyngbya sp. Heron Island J]